MWHRQTLGTPPMQGTRGGEETMVDQCAGVAVIPDSVSSVDTADSAVEDTFVFVAIP